MGLFRKQTEKRHVTLNTTNAIGRSTYSHFVLEEASVSKKHATITWNGSNWILQDHSRNGTLINNKLVSNTSVVLHTGDLLKFGVLDNNCWEITDCSAPHSYLVNTSNNETIDLLECVAFPNDHSAEILFFKHGETWVAETTKTNIQLSHNETYNFLNSSWRFYYNESLDETLDTRSITEQAIFEFELSPDEEQVSLSIVLNDLSINLGDRAHNHLLLALARKRLESNPNSSKGNLGWTSIEALVTSLSKELLREVDEYYLNLLIHRFRKHVAAQAPYGSLFTPSLQRTNGQIRLNAPHLRIIQGDTILVDTLQNINTYILTN